MTMMEALIKCTESIKEILISADLVEGEALERIDETDTIIFWHSLAKNGGGNKDTYIVWNVMPTTSVIKADDSSKLWLGSAFIDIFTRYSITYLSIQQLLKRVNLEAINKGWEVALFEAPSYDPEFKRTRITIQATKIL